MHEKIHKIEKALEYAKDTKNHKMYNINGLSSSTNQAFLKKIATDKNVFEIGAFCGASTVAMAESAIHVVTCDNFKGIETIPRDNSNNYIDISGEEAKKQFLENTLRFKNISLIEKDIYSIETFKKIKEFTKGIEIIFYDGSHKAEDILKFLIMYESIILGKILIFDDYNFGIIQEIVFFFEEYRKRKIRYKKEIFTSGESKNTFWNGLGIFIIE